MSACIRTICLWNLLFCMPVQWIPGSGWQANAYLVGEILIDAGILPMAVERYRNQIKTIILTHGHFDHVMGNAFVVKTWGVKTYINPQDKPQLERAFSYGEMFGYSIEQPPADTIDVSDGDKIEFGNSYLKVITTPGHTRGGVCYYTEEPENKIVFAGDSLFAGSIGRTDLPGGDYDDLMNSLLKKIVELGDDYKVLSGHGPETTISHELSTNPFLRYE
ncbi:MAG: MBL fold metallo-hydrolase [Bacteroidia bacterium]|nr:MBL fold metallo-hydrolase [Bacteroidia bacterium]